MALTGLCRFGVAPRGYQMFQVHLESPTDSETGSQGKTSLASAYQEHCWRALWESSSMLNVTRSWELAEGLHGAFWKHVGGPQGKGGGTFLENLCGRCLVASMWWSLGQRELLGLSSHCHSASWCLFLILRVLICLWLWVRPVIAPTHSLINAPRLWIQVTCSFLVTAGPAEGVPLWGQDLLTATGAVTGVPWYDRLSCTTC